jgi:hypothetical protein
VVVNKKPEIEEPKEQPVVKQEESASNISATQEFPTTAQFDTALETPKETGHNWYSSFYGLSTERFPNEVSDILLESIKESDIEIKPGK